MIAQRADLAIAASEICMTNQIGCQISLDKVPGDKLDSDRILFSESHSRYLLVLEKKNYEAIRNNFTKMQKVSYKVNW